MSVGEIEREDIVCYAQKGLFSLFLLSEKTKGLTVVNLIERESQEDEDDLVLIPTQ